MGAPEDFEAWFRLLQTPNLGRDKVRQLLAACGSPQAVLRAPAAQWRQIAGPAAADALGRVPADLATRWKAALDWLDGGADRHVLVLGDPAFPPRLLQTADPPLLLYVQGRPAALAGAGVAVVGSRRATAQGLDNARAFAAALSQQGLVVFSGLALGVDAAAHEGALTGPAGTVAVVGTGLDRVYPPRHQPLAERIAAHGALVSEYAPGMPPLAENFPQRNRIIAGLSLGTLVVEAALQSGSLITARLAVEACREVFAIPGSIHAPQSRGCHALIKQGAKLVETAQDIVEELRLAIPAQARLPLEEPPVEDPLLQALGHDPVTIDALGARTGWPAAELAVRLLELELEGRVARLPGGLYQQRQGA
jgi:DNA processing protein